MAILQIENGATYTQRSQIEHQLSALQMEIEQLPLDQYTCGNPALVQFIRITRSQSSALLYSG